MHIQTMPEAYFPAKALFFFQCQRWFSLAASDLFPFDIGFDIPGKKGELRNSLKLLSFLLFLLTFTSWTCISFFFPDFSKFIQPIKTFIW